MFRKQTMTPEEKRRLIETPQTPEEKLRRKEERLREAEERQRKRENREYLGASLKAAGSALTPLGMITGWGQGDLKRLNAEKRQKAEMEKLIAAVKESKQEAPKPREALTYCSQCNVGNPLTAKFCNNCGRAIERA
jgi:hypothetical protein